MFLEFSDLLRTEFIAKLSEIPSEWDPNSHLERLYNFSDDGLVNNQPISIKENKPNLAVDNFEAIQAQILSGTIENKIDTAEPATTLT